jgi:hypothetical protein
VLWQLARDGLIAVKTSTSFEMGDTNKQACSHTKGSVFVATLPRYLAYDYWLVSEVLA